MNDLQRPADRYHSDSEFHALVGLIEHGLASGKYSIQEFREATTLAAWKVADRTIRPINHPFPWEGKIMKQTKTEKALDFAIEREYYKRARGVQIDIMNLRPLYKYVKVQLTQGVAIGLAVQDAISKYRELNEVIP